MNEKNLYIIQEKNIMRHVDFFYSSCCLGVYKLIEDYKNKHSTLLLKGDE